MKSLETNAQRSVSGQHYIFVHIMRLCWKLNVSPKCEFEQCPAKKQIVMTSNDNWLDNTCNTVRMGRPVMLYLWTALLKLLSWI